MVAVPFANALCCIDVADRNLASGHAYRDRRGNVHRRDHKLFRSADADDYRPAAKPQAPGAPVIVGVFVCDRGQASRTLRTRGVARDYSHSIVLGGFEEMS
jgi:hypothetical protein